MIVRWGQISLDFSLHLSLAKGSHHKQAGTRSGETLTNSYQRGFSPGCLRQGGSIVSLGSRPKPASSHPNLFPIPIHSRSSSSFIVTNIVVIV